MVTCSLCLHLECACPLVRGLGCAGPCCKECVPDHNMQTMPLSMLCVCHLARVPARTVLHHKHSCCKLLSYIVCCSCSVTTFSGMWGYFNVEDSVSSFHCTVIFWTQQASAVSYQRMHTYLLCFFLHKVLCMKLSRSLRVMPTSLNPGQSFDCRPCALFSCTHIRSAFCSHQACMAHASQCSYWHMTTLHCHEIDAIWVAVFDSCIICRPVASAAVD